VFARTLGLPDDPVEATGALLDAVARNSIRRVGLGSVNKRYFLFHCGIGYDAAVVSLVEKRGQLKRYAGHPLFVYAAVDTWLRHYDRKHPHFAVQHEDGTLIDDGYFGICFNTDPYTYLGARPLSLAPDATLDTPLTMVTIRTMRLSRLAALVVRSLRGKSIAGARSVDYHANVTDFTIRGYSTFPYQVDGDYLGEVSTLRFRYEPAILDLVIP
jgi:diacylglycerol kinase family enzyme